MKMMNNDFNFSFLFLFHSSMAKSSSTIQIYQKSQTSPLPSTGSKSAKNSSATPTPTMSTQDVVRIYVPPADDMIPDIKHIVQQRERGDDEISQCSNRSSIIHVEYETLPFERSSSHIDKSPPSHHPKSPSKTDQSPTGANKFQPQQYYYYPNPSQTVYQSSSSRRGSMTRKSPSPLLNELIVECDHMRVRRSQENVNEDYSVSYSVNNGNVNSNNKIYQFNNNNNNSSSSLKRLTSFEELAKKSESNSLLYINETSADNNFRRHSKPKSDYNICYNYKNLEKRDEPDYTSMKHQLMIKKSTSHSYNIRRSERKHSSSDNSPFDYDLLKEKRKENRFMYDDDGSEGRQLENNDNSIKSYDRFFNSDDEMEDDEIRHNRATKKSSSSGAHKYRSHISGTEADDDDENSSNSPPNKSILNTPMNETMPLLSSDADGTTHYPSVPPPVLPSSSNSLRQKSRIPRPNRGNSNNNSLRKTSSVSSPDGSDKSDGYQTTINRFDNRPAQPVAYQSPPSYRTGSVERGSSQRSDNKIRIKINQKT